MPGKSVGEMVLTSLVEQFTRSRDGDRFFYTGDTELFQSDITAVVDLEAMTLAEIIRLNTGITNIQNNVFFLRISSPRLILLTLTRTETSIRLTLQS